MDKIFIDLYTDYLIASTGQVTATGLSKLLNNEVSHDKITRSLSQSTFTSVELWAIAKPMVRKIQEEDAVLVIDDSVEAKPHSDESELNCWHFDHTVGKSVKGVNLITCLYYSQNISLPIAYEFVIKPDIVTDKKTGRPTRKAKKTKQQIFRELLLVCVKNGVIFRYVLCDTWFASAENMIYVKTTLNKEFVMPLKENRKVSLSPPNTPNREFVPVTSLTIEKNQTIKVWLEGVDFPLLLTKQVFHNKDGSTGVLYLVTSDLTLTASEIQALYKKRWKVEEYHKSLKSNLCFSKSPTHTIRTQCNHFFLCLVAFIKMEQMRIQLHLNHFAMKGKLYEEALASAYKYLQQMKEKCVFV